jgi:hypothetical protein
MGGAPGGLRSDRSLAIGPLEGGSVTPRSAIERMGARR